jgi:hypothetical protein
MAGAGVATFTAKIASAASAVRRETLPVASEAAGGSFAGAVTTFSWDDLGKRTKR